MDELGLRNREGKASGCSHTAQGAEVVLKELNIAPVGGGRDCDHKVVHVGDNDALGDHWV